MNLMTAAPSITNKHWFQKPTHDHLVQFYYGDDALMAPLTTFIASGLQHDETCMVIATPEHRKTLEAHLAKRVNIDKAIQQGRYRAFDAATALSSFTQNNQVVQTEFLKVVGAEVQKALATGRSLRAYGEMVALLWKTGNDQAALQLEHFWNQLAEDYDFALFCAYPAYHFDDTPHHKDVLNKIKESHSLIA